MHKNTPNMSETVLECSQCKRKYDKEEEIGTDICGHRKCRDCILAADSRNCYQCAVPGTSTMQQAQNKCAAAMSSSLRKKDSKIANQTHIIEEYSETGDLQYRCTFCDKRFSSRTQRYYHLYCNQLDSESHECDICKKTFARLSQLKYHKESHASPINECLICHKNYSNPLALRKHENLHKAEPRSCPQCGKTFVQKISLEQHIAAKHLNQLQYECNKCNKKYASKSTLQLHLQSHEEKRFKCPICAKLYQRNSILTIHLKTHNKTDDEAASYICEVCKKTFTESTSLARHQKIHNENELIYHCKECGANIPRRDNMTRHIFSMHPVLQFDDIVEMIKPSPKMFEERHHNYLRRREFCPNQDGTNAEIYNGPSTSRAHQYYYGNYVNSNKSKHLENRETVVILENKRLHSSNVMPYFHNNEFQYETATSDTSSVNQIEVTLPPNRYLYEYVSADQIQYTGNFVLSITRDQEPFTFEECQVNNHVEVENQIEYNPTSTLYFDQDNTFKEPETRTNSNADTHPPYVINEPIDLANTKSAFSVDTHPPYGINEPMPTADTKSASNVDTHRQYVINEPIDLAITKSASNVDTHPPYGINEPIDLANSKLAVTENDKKLENIVPTSQPDLEAASTSYSATVDQPIHNKTSVIRSIGNVTKHLTPQSPAVSPQSTVSEKSASHFPQHTEYKHKKYNRHYNVKLYRKILGCDDDNDTEDNKQQKQQQCSSKEKKQQSSSETRNPTPVHWRKNFKNSYETSGS